MTEYASISANEDAIEAARKAKQPNETWGDYLLRCADSDVPREWTESEVRDVASDAAEEVLRKARERNYMDRGR